jgi:hypothetical protein
MPRGHSLGHGLDEGAWLYIDRGKRFQVSMAEHKAPSTNEVLHRNITALNTRDTEGYLATKQSGVDTMLSGGAAIAVADCVKKAHV